VFFPAAGCRSYHDGTVGLRGGDGCYWSSRADYYYAYYFYFDGSSYASMSGWYRAFGYSVRCVQE
jgi:hypothetical protein